MMNTIEQVGISTSGSGKTAAEAVQAFASQLLVPDLVGSTQMSVSVSTAKSIIRSAGTTSELGGLSAFLAYLKAHNLGISSPDQVWKYATFITYIADSRDIAALNLSGFNSSVVQGSPFSTLTNLLQAATYTITTFSGECSAYARLYAATQTLINKSVNGKFYNVFYTPKQGTNLAGHATTLWTTDDKTWHVTNYMNELVGDNPWNLLGYLWQNLYQMNLNDFSVTVVKNIYYDPKLSQKSFVDVVASQDFQYLKSQGFLTNPTNIQVIDHQRSSEYKTYGERISKLLQIQSFSGSLSGTTLSMEEFKKYLPYIAIGGISLIALSNV